MSIGTMLFNPFTGKPRDPRDIASDPRGILVWDGEEPLKSAASPQPAAQPERFITYAHCTGGARFRQSINDPLPAWAYDVRLDEPEQSESGVLTDERIDELMAEGFPNTKPSRAYRIFAHAVAREALSTSKLSDEQGVKKARRKPKLADALDSLQEAAKELGGLNALHATFDSVQAGEENLRDARAEVERLLRGEA